MENRAHTQCDRCGRFFVGGRGLGTHQRIGTRCVPFQREPEIQNDVAVDDIYNDFPVLTFDRVDEEERVPLIEIEGYSLEYLKIPVDLFHNLKHERPELGRFVSLQNFAQLATANQTRSLDCIFRFFYITLSTLFWFSRILCIVSLAFVFYYTHDDSCFVLYYLQINLICSYYVFIKAFGNI
ncbi:hypothetical protein BD770DRAFT_382834 [Pilaira anomala]|nr:hypothetical protein BD770DRAFT_382834 [Pilaira anomala]